MANVRTADTAVAPSTHDAPAQRQPSGPASAASGRRRLVGLFVAAGLLLGFGIAYVVLRAPRTPTPFDGPPSVQSIDRPARVAGASTAAAALQPATIAEPATARDALRQFLEAEMQRRPEVSFSLLDAASKERAGSVAAWQGERATRLLPEGFSIRAERPSPEGVDITINATRTPAVTAVTGLVPSRSEEVWRVTKAGGWRVAGGRPIEVRPVLPEDSAAAATAATWLAHAEACDQRAAANLQLSPSLLGSPDLRDVPCTEPAPFTAGNVIPVSELPNPTVFVAAYGPGVGRWGRAVRASGNGGFVIVLAPLGDEWRVMGVVPEGSPRQ